MARRSFPTRLERPVLRGIYPVAVAACALYFGPFGPTAAPDRRSFRRRRNRITSSCALCIALVAASFDGTPALLIGPVVAIMALLLLPSCLVKGKELASTANRVLTVLLIAVTLGTFTHLAALLLGVRT